MFKILKAQTRNDNSNNVDDSRKSTNSRDGELPFGKSESNGKRDFSSSGADRQEDDLNHTKTNERNSKVYKENGVNWFLKNITLKSARIIKKKQHISSSFDVLAPNPTPKAVESMNAISNHIIPEKSEKVNINGRNSKVTERKSLQVTKLIGVSKEKFEKKFAKK